MPKLPPETITELLAAMDHFETLARQLINKLIAETDQPKKAAIVAGNYDEIQHADVLNGQQYLSGNWAFDVHGEHCMFKNAVTGQTLEVSLGNPESIGNLDPYFFYQFLDTTAQFNHLTGYFNRPFQDMLDFFEALERQNQLASVYGVQFKRLKP